jgi:hypothetical protein
MVLSSLALQVLASVFELIAVVEEDTVWLVDRDFFGLERDAWEVLDGVLKSILQVLRVDLETSPLNVCIGA